MVTLEAAVVLYPQARQEAAVALYPLAHQEAVAVADGRSHLKGVLAEAVGGHPPLRA